MNALKHGIRSRKLALLREESIAFEERLRKWMAIGDAQNDVEEYLVYRNVCISFELDRAERARAERCRSLIENSDEEEVALAQAVGKQLFFDPAGPTSLYGNRTVAPSKQKTSWNGEAVDPNDPAALVKILEGSAAGCCWLRQEWQALRAQLDSTGFWQSHDRLKATRLLGRQPVEANDDRRVATIFVANDALRPAAKSEFDDLLTDMEDQQCNRYARAVRERWPDLYRTREKEDWRQMLVDLADQNIERLTAKLEVHEQNADAQAERIFARLSFDPSPEGEVLRNYQIKCTNALFRGMANYRNYQAKTGGRAGVASGVGRHGTQTDGREATGYEAHKMVGAGLEGDESFGPGDGQHDRLERARRIGPDRMDPPGDEPSNMGEISEDAPNEANFDESTSIAEARESVQVTANSGALAGLDKAMDQPEKGSTPEQGNAQGPVSENGSAEPPTRDSSGRASQPDFVVLGGPGSDQADDDAGTRRVAPGGPPSQNRATPMSGDLPADVSKRETIRPRCEEEERRVVERMVEAKLKAGCIPLREILTSAMELPLPGGRGP